MRDGSTEAALEQRVVAGTEIRHHADPRAVRPRSARILKPLGTIAPFESSNADPVAENLGDRAAVSDQVGVG